MQNEEFENHSDKYCLNAIYLFNILNLDYKSSKINKYINKIKIIVTDKTHLTYIIEFISMTINIDF